MSNAVVFAGGTFSGILPREISINTDDYIICADRGIEFCNRYGYNVDLWAGDFDSSDFEAFCEYPCVKNAEIIRLNPIKDNTDTEFAIDCAVKRGYNNVILVGGLGSRQDHSLANIFLMEKYFKKGVTVTIADENNIIHYISNNSLSLKKGTMKYFSLLPLDDNIIVSNEGFLYKLSHKTMNRSSSLGISNELICETGYIKVNGGAALVIESKD